MEQLESTKEPIHIDSNNIVISEKKGMSSISYYKITIVLLIAALVVIGYNIYNSYTTNKFIEDKTNEIAESARPADISLKIINDKTCIGCFDTNLVLASIKANNVKVAEEKVLDYSDKEAKDLLTKYNINKIPTVIVEGEVDKANLQGFAKKDNVLIFDTVQPPYKDVTSDTVKGYVSAIMIKAPDCDECFNITMVLSQLESAIKVKDRKELAYSDAEAKELINNYSLTVLPALILSGDIVEYGQIYSALSSLGTMEDDGNYVLREIVPPHLNLSTGDIDGLVKLTMITDESCKECYNVSIHKTVLLRFNLIPDGEETIDISTDKGKDMVRKYNITNVPTIILSGEASAYKALNKVWSQIGTVENDGYYIFRDLSVLQVDYKDLKNNEIIRASESPAE